MKYLIVFIIFFSIISYAQDVPLDEPEQESAEGQLGEQTESQTEEPPTEQPATSEQSNRGFDVFQPTEDISEDLAVPFPVDI